MKQMYKIVCWIAIWVFLCLSVGFILGYECCRRQTIEAFTSITTVPCDITIHKSSVEVHEFQGTVKA